jgi:hypothetical protein
MRLNNEPFHSGGRQNFPHFPAILAVDQITAGDISPHLRPFLRSGVRIQPFQRAQPLRLEVCGFGRIEGVLDESNAQHTPEIPSGMVYVRISKIS